MSGRDAPERPLHLHVGLPKTASTFLQNQVFPALDHLAVRTVPRTRLFRERADAAVEFRTFACALRRSAALWPSIGEPLLDELLGPDADGRRGLLVSDEAIGRAASRPEGLAAHLSAFASLARARGFARPRIVAFLRRQDHWLASHYAQISDRKRGAGEAGFRATVAATLDPAAQKHGFGTLLDYAALRAALVDVAGEDGVLLLPHEALVAEPEPTLRRLLDWLGTPPALAERLATAKGRDNVRSDTAGSVLQWQLRPPSIPLPRGRRLALPAGIWPARRISLPADLSRRILGAYGDSNRDVAAATGLDLGRWGYFAGPATV
ncbi:hypothetical protein [uncultured Jannaschia sp.]|uniref:hypothetical protein n=1 Tax=uncultured Jannaschia sp. TaxID=293347 RepID=UPI00260F9AEA|nr:hypothetical protein [uncultured Jannaschia sp.]